MKIVRLAVLLFLLSTGASQAQYPSRVTSGVDLGTGYRDKVWAPSLAYHQELSINNFPWFNLSWGVRTAGYYSGDKTLTPKNSFASGDSLKFGRLTSNSLSIMAGITFKFGKFDFGANTDIIGIAIGVKRKGLYTKTSFPLGEESEYYNTLVSSSPNFFNVVPLGMDKNSGQSEVFVRYWIGQRVGIKAGYVHGRTTYKTEYKLDNNQNRFSTTYDMPYVAICFPLYN
jgi:hypothetical protein